MALKFNFMNVKAKGYILGAVAESGFGTFFPLSFCHTCVGDDDRGEREKF